VLLFGGSAALIVMLAYSALEAPAGRPLLVASLALFGFSFVPQLYWRGLMGEWVWGARYIGVAGIATGLLLRLRRTRPGRYGASLRLAAIVAGWWGLQHVFVLSWTHASQTVRSELFSRSVYVLLAIGLLDMRRWLGGAPEREPARTSSDAAREIATTRVCLALVSIGSALSALTYTWHSEWVVIAGAEALALAVTLALHVPWVLRERGLTVPALVAPFALFGFGFAWRAFDSRGLAPLATISCAAVAIAVDASVARFAWSAKTDSARPAYRLALAAIALHVVNAAIICYRVAA
jgi:hypothetical protein